MRPICVFTLNRGNATYNVGEVIEGRASLEAYASIVAEDVLIKFTGQGNVNWQELSESRRDLRRAPTLVEFNDTEMFTNIIMYGQGPDELFAKTYRFSFPIPLNCPQSCEYIYGDIQYNIILKIITAGDSDYTYRQPITVLRPLDLNASPTYNLPILCSYEAPSGPSYELYLFRNSFVPGEIVKYVLRKSNHFADCYTIKFIQNITFTDRTKFCSKNLKHRLVSISHSNVQSQEFTGDFLLPAMLPPTESTSIICVEYVLKVILRNMNCCLQKIKVPITIGTIPHYQHTYSFRHPSDEQQIVEMNNEIIEGAADSDDFWYPDHSHVETVEMATGEIFSIIDLS